jgi:hypothetical protein
MAEGEDYRGAEPRDRLTRLCAAMTEALDAHPERGDEKCIVFLQSPSSGRGGIQLHGYEDDSEAMAELFVHMKAIFESNGKELHILPIEEVGRG